MNQMLEPVFEMAKEHLLHELIPYVTNAIETAVENVKAKFVPMLKDFFISFGKSNNTNTFCIDVDILNKQRLIKIAQEHIVIGASETVAYKSEMADTYVVYLAYSKNKELLDTDNNCYVIIKCEAIAKDVNDLFGNEKLIVLK